MTPRRLLPLPVWHEDCWGCGTTHGSADLTFIGTHSGPAHAEFTANAPGGLLCLTTGTASGHISGPFGIDIDFYATRLGPWMLITTSGDVTGTGTAVWVTTQTACGAGVEATIAGTIVGI